jgi:integrase
MPRLVHALPKYRRHRGSGQAVVTICGTDHYLGKWRSKKSRIEYDRLISEWTAAGRPARGVDRTGITVVELCAAYLRWAEGYYRKNGRPTRSIERVRLAMAALRQTYGDTPVADFTPVSLEAIQRQLVTEGKSRPYVNALVAQIKRVFKRGVAILLVPPSVLTAIEAVEGLKKDRTTAREPEPIGPVPDSVIDATLAQLAPVVADMVRFQRLTGARPGEVCSLRPCDVDRTNDVWIYRPASHKTQHHGRDRVIFIGPQAKELLSRYMLRPSETFCFSPAENRKAHDELRRAARKTKVQPSQRDRRKKRPECKPKDRYSVNGYEQAVRRAAARADRNARLAAEKAGKPPSPSVRLIPHWAPNQLRHARATEIGHRFGKEFAKAVLGHSKMAVTDLYVEPDLERAASIMREVG